MIRTDIALGSKSIPGYRHRVEGRENEDAAFVSNVHPVFDAVMILSDGMGGHPEPKRAAESAVSAARDVLFAPERLKALAGRSLSIRELLHQAVQHANGRVRRLAGQPQRAARSVAAPAASSRSNGKPPGCTLIIAVIGDGRLAAANVGDGSVFLYRDDRLRPMAGGESRRLGSRPEEFLGRADRVEVEAAEHAIQPGDRILICTDGLTRYFGGGKSDPMSPATRPDASDGLERLQQVVGRIAADPQALASQLTADGRGELYEDDTTVIVADVGSSRELPDPPPPESRRRGEERVRIEAAPPSTAPRASTGAGFWPLGVIVALAAGVAIGTWHPWRRSPESAPPVFQPFAGPPVNLSTLPRGGVVLVQRGTNRLYVLRTRPVGVPAGDEPALLSELRFQPGKGVKDTGNTYRLDTGRGRLVDPTGRSYPVTVDGSTGVIEILQSGVLRLNTRPAGMAVFIDGRSAGRAPISLTVPAGKHQVEIHSSAGSVLGAFVVDVPPRSTVSFSQDFSSSAGGRAARP
jgi:serine/threonine protein phosphatase PrpC